LLVASSAGEAGQGISYKIVSEKYYNNEMMTPTNLNQGYVGHRHTSRSDEEGAAGAVFPRTAEFCVDVVVVTRHTKFNKIF